MTLIPRFSEPLQASRVQGFFLCTIATPSKHPNLRIAWLGCNLNTSPQGALDIFLKHKLHVFFSSVHPDPWANGGKITSALTHIFSKRCALHRRLCREQYPTVSWPTQGKLYGVLIPDCDLFGEALNLYNFMKFLKGQVSICRIWKYAPNRLTLKIEVS